MLFYGEGAENGSTSEKRSEFNSTLFEYAGETRITKATLDYFCFPGILNHDS